MQNVIRKTIDGWSEFKFAQFTSSFFIKNFGNGVALVSFANDKVETNTIKIPAGMAEEVTVSDSLKNAVYVKASGEIEVQELN